MQRIRRPSRQAVTAGPSEPRRGGCGSRAGRCLLGREWQQTRGAPETAYFFPSDRWRANGPRLPQHIGRPPALARGLPASLCHHLWVGIFDSVSRAFGSLRPLSDEELDEERESLRNKYVSSSDIAQADRLYNELHRYDEEMTRRANEAYERDNPDATTRHREHGWYLPNDD